jgi:aldehyde:ferredoxin oxidoreductase
MVERYGQGSEAFAMQVKGLEAGMHDPRIASGLAWSFMLAPTGADHCAATPDGFLANEKMFEPFHVLGWSTPPGANDLGPRKLAIFRESQFLNILCDSLVVCQFPNISFEQATDLVKATTGWDTGLPELLRIAERTITSMRLFNLREGFTQKDDMLPERFFQATTDGFLADLKVDKSGYEKSRQYYYRLMGWDANGVPLPEKIEELSIEWDQPLP